jgi:uncharacterized membrane protein
MALRGDRSDGTGSVEFLVLLRDSANLGRERDHRSVHRPGVGAGLHGHIRKAAGDRAARDCGVTSSRRMRAGNRSRQRKTGPIGCLGSLGCTGHFVWLQLLQRRRQPLLRRNSQWTVLLYALLGSAVFWALVNPPWKLFALHHSLPQWGFLFLFAVGSILIPFSLYLGGLRRLDPTRAIVTSCLEPVFAIAFAALFLGESMGWLQIVGIAVVLAATVAIQIPEAPLRSSA